MAVVFGASGAGGGVSRMQKGIWTAQGFRTWWVVVHGNSRQMLAPGIAHAQSTGGWWVSLMEHAQG